MKQIAALCLFALCACGSSPERPAADPDAPPAEAEQKAPSEGGDPVAASPAIYKVLGENDRVRVLLATWPAGKRDAWHEQPRLIAFALTEVKGLHHLPDGEPKSVELPEGAVTYRASEPSIAFENTSGKEAKLLLVELKPNMGEAPKPRGTLPDAVTAAAGIYDVRLDLDQARVLMATFKAGQKDEPHTHPPHVVYYLGAFKGRETGASGQPTAVDHAAGTLSLHDTIDGHRLENKGEDTRFLVVELK